jgi:hypothetical protein
VVFFAPRRTTRKISTLKPLTRLRFRAIDAAVAPGSRSRDKRRIASARDVRYTLKKLTKEIVTAMKNETRINRLVAALVSVYIGLTNMVLLSERYEYYGAGIVDRELRFKEFLSRVPFILKMSYWLPFIVATSLIALHLIQLWKEKKVP